MGSPRFISYEQEHVKFVTSENGTSSQEILTVIASISFLPMLASLIFPWLMPGAFTLRFGQDVLSHQFIRFLIEYPIIALSSGAFITFLAGQPDVILISFCVTVSITLLILTVNHTLTRPIWTSLSLEWNKLKRQNMGWSSQDFILVNIRQKYQQQKQKAEANKLPFVTNFRGMITYVTLLSILAVDFPIFPRSFAKTKTFGVSLMDTGTAAFIFCNGIVSPESRNRASGLKKALISSLPLFIIGFIRLATVKGSEYHEVIEEYGVHWNFFFTLGVVKILGSLIFSIVETESSLKMCAVIGILYEIFLVGTNIQDGYILNPNVSRDGSLIDANREGIVSVLGYLSVYMGSVYCGRILYHKNRTTVQDWTSYLVQISLQCLILWPLFHMSHTYGNPACRRVANLSYILWSLAMSYTILTLHVALSLLQTIVQHYGILHGPMISYHLYIKYLKEHGQYFDPASPISPIKPNESCPSSAASAASQEKPTSGEKKNSISEEDVNEALDLLDRKLDQVRESSDEISKEHLNKYLNQIEGELDTLSKQCKNKETEREAKNDDDGQACSSNAAEKKTAELPDLSRASLFFEAICYNNLGSFLLANLLTGLINYNVHTMYARPIEAAVFMTCYASVIYFVTFILYWFNIQLKFW